MRLFLNCFCISCFLIFSSSSFATPRDDFYIQEALDRYFPVPADARSLSTGGASNLVTQEGISAFLNPAGLGALRQVEISGSIGTSRSKGEDFLEGEEFEQVEDGGNLILAIPLGNTDQKNPEYGTLALAYSRYAGTSDDKLSTTPDGHHRTIGYGYAPSAALSLGYTFVFYDDQLHNDLGDLHSHARILHIIGAQYQLDEVSSLGMAFKYGLGQSDTEDYIKQSDGLSRPRQYTGALGFSRSYGATKIMAAADYSYVESTGNLTDISPGVFFGGDEEGNFYNIRVGTEHSYNNGFLTRGGIRWYDVVQYDFHRSDVRDLSGELNGIGLSLGLGYEFKHTEGARGVRLDYGIEYLTALDGQVEHRISLVLPL